MFIMRFVVQVSVTDVYFDYKMSRCWVRWISGLAGFSSPPLRWSSASFTHILNIYSPDVCVLRFGLLWISLHICNSYLQMPSCIHVLLVVLSIISNVCSLIYYPIIVALLEVLVFSKFAHPALHYIWLQPFCSRQIHAADSANPETASALCNFTITGACFCFYICKP